MADWIESKFNAVSCFCSSRPDDLTPGMSWFQEIVQNAITSEICLVLISPYSKFNNWLHFEMGISKGANSNSTIIPVLFGGMKITELPPTMSTLEILDINNPSQFNSFVLRYFDPEKKIGNNTSYYSHFATKMRKSTKRIKQFGEFGLLNPSKGIISQSLGRQTFSSETEVFEIERTVRNKDLLSIRLKVIPRRVKDVQRWKFGISLTKNDKSDRIFQFHCGSHHRLNSWSIYIDDNHRSHPVNIPAALQLETSIVMEIWLDKKGQYITCVGLDSNNNRLVINNDYKGNEWRMITTNWTKVLLYAWADGQEFKIDVEDIEIDRG